MHDLSLNRRGLLKVGLLGGAVLAGGGLLSRTLCASADGPASGFFVLRDSDLPMLRRLTPLLLEGSAAPDAMPQAVQTTLVSLDRGLHHLSPALLGQVRQLFDVLSLPLTRGPLTGIWSHWDAASDDQLRAFLLRWQNSSLALLRQGHASLLQMTFMAWYASPVAWAHCGYPGPPTV
ncbi:twin-arginine translocation pathway signal protein [Stutzerimonas stutzeri]|uniref:Twin-arginine translocation pathway signal protein n=1 Tax=Stutzerimonas stutzeri TaxID=316 RepID=A0A2S4AL07_STUST|nr:twin-arginine translocation pathway signal protein [Stutzerimonas stutzeri]MCQ4264064.1 twin-arginine translocation pathway signal protein [Stutzerimonas stutzeri]POH82044.1 twin-arginine translocation pathway signal protein [Stutzerimonas stutzeri]